MQYLHTWSIACNISILDQLHAIFASLINCMQYLHTWSIACNISILDQLHAILAYVINCMQYLHTWSIACNISILDQLHGMVWTWSDHLCFEKPMLLLMRWVTFNVLYVLACLCHRYLWPGTHLFLVSLWSAFGHVYCNYHLFSLPHFAHDAMFNLVIILGKDIITLLFHSCIADVVWINGCTL